MSDTPYRWKGPPRPPCTHGQHGGTSYTPASTTPPPGPPASTQQTAPGDKPTQAPDGGTKAHQHALAHITVPPCSPPTKELRHRAPHRPGGASPPHHHRALYTLAAHERHWDPTTIPAMPPPPQGPKDRVTPFHIDQLSWIKLSIASWDSLGTPPQQPAIHILKADA